MRKSTAFLLGAFALGTVACTPQPDVSSERPSNLDSESADLAHNFGFENSEVLMRLRQDSYVIRLNTDYGTPNSSSVYLFNSLQAGLSMEHISRQSPLGNLTGLHIALDHGGDIRGAHDTIGSSVSLSDGQRSEYSELSDTLQDTACAVISREASQEVRGDFQKLCKGAYFLYPLTVNHG